MNNANVSRVIGAVLLLLMAAAIGLGSAALWSGRPINWVDVVAGNDVAVGTSRWMAVMAALLIISAIAALTRARWALVAVTVALTLFLAGSVFANIRLFGNWQPTHIATNLAVSLVVWLLIRKGADSEPERK